MYFSKYMFVTKGPLSPVWLASHNDGKSFKNAALSKQAVLKMDVGTAVANIMQPVAPLALRLSGQLLVGVSRIYASKIVYLHEDAQYALARIRIAVVTGGRNKVSVLAADDAQAAEGAITLGGGARARAAAAADLDDFALSLTLDDDELAQRLHDADRLRARPDDISIAQPRGLGGGGGVDFSLEGDFLDIGFEMDRDLDQALPVGRDGTVDTSMDLSAGLRDSLLLGGGGDKDGLDGTLMDMDLPEIDMNLDGGDLDKISINPDELKSQNSDRPALLDAARESSALPAADAAAAAKRTRGIKRRMLHRDRAVEIKADVYKSWTDDASSLVVDIGARSWVPRKRGRFCDGADADAVKRAFERPATLGDGRSWLPEHAQFLVEAARRLPRDRPALAAASAAAGGAGGVGETTSIDISMGQMGFSGLGGPGMDSTMNAGQLDLPDLDLEIAPAGDAREASGVRGTDLERVPDENDEFFRGLDDSQKLQSPGDAASAAAADAKDETSDWSKRSQRMVQWFSARDTNFEDEDRPGEFSFQEMVRGKNRTTTARVFYELLVLKSHNFVDVEQKDCENYGDIIVTKNPDKM